MSDRWTKNNLMGNRCLRSLLVLANPWRWSISTGPLMVICPCVCVLVCWCASMCIKESGCVVVRPRRFWIYVRRTEQGPPLDVNTCMRVCGLLLFLIPSRGGVAETGRRTGTDNQRKSIKSKSGREMLLMDMYIIYVLFFCFVSISPLRLYYHNVKWLPRI